MVAIIIIYNQKAVMKSWLSFYCRHQKSDHHKRFFDYFLRATLYNQKLRLAKAEFVIISNLEMSFYEEIRSKSKVTNIQYAYAVPDTYFVKRRVYFY